MINPNIEAAEKVCYEIRMLYHAYGRLCQLKGDGNDIEFANVGDMVGSGMDSDDALDTSAWLECFLIHSRALYDFFAFRESKPSDDMFATHFCPDWNAESASNKLAPVDKVRINKALAHLTSTRIMYCNAKDGWDVDKMLSSLDAVIEQFLNQLPEDRVDWFESLKEIVRLRFDRGD